MIFLIPVLVILIDQLTKILAVNKLAGGYFPLIEGVLHFTYVENTGAAFGIFKNGNLFLVFTSVLIIVGIIIYLFVKKPKGMINIPLGLIVGGAVGNLIDRIFRGFVVDFIYFVPIDFPVFNVADIAVVCGAILLALIVLYEEKSNGKD